MYTYTYICAYSQSSLVHQSVCFLISYRRDHRHGHSKSFLVQSCILSVLSSNMCIYLYLLRLRTVSTSTHATSTYCGHSRSLTCRPRPAHLVICADVSPLVQSLSVTGSQRFFKCTRNSSLNHEVPNGAFKEQKKVTH